jgi:hypothetical protein
MEARKDGGISTVIIKKDRIVVHDNAILGADKTVNPVKQKLITKYDPLESTTEQAIPEAEQTPTNKDEDSLD